MAHQPWPLRAESLSVVVHLTPNHTPQKMRTLRLCALIALGMALGYAFSEAADAPKEAHPAKCCAPAGHDGKKCDHSCCEAAAKEGKNCEKCGGKN